MSESEESPSFLDLSAASILAIGTVVAALCGWFGALWGGQQAGGYTQAIFTLSQANTTYLEAQTAHSALALDQFKDDMLYAQYREATRKNDVDDAAYFQSQMSDEFQKTLEAEDGAAEAKAVAEFEAKSEADLVALQAKVIAAAQGSTEAKKRLEEGEKANENGDQFGLVSVLAAVAMFFAGLAPMVKTRKLKTAYVVMATLVLLGSIILAVRVPLPF
jgi:hypothetical protein